MKYLSLFLIFCFSFIFLVGCTPAKYNVVDYCEQDSDCRFEEDNCCGFAVNYYNYQSLKYEGIAPPCHTICLPEDLRKIECVNNRCEVVIDCSDCDEVLSQIAKQGCNDKPPESWGTASSLCKQLLSCECKGVEALEEN